VPLIIVYPVHVAWPTDIICVQETKLRRTELTRDVAVAEGWESFWNCCQPSIGAKSGYSGVATFCKAGALPVSCEAGLTGSSADPSGLCCAYPSMHMAARCAVCLPHVSLTRHHTCCHRCFKGWRRHRLRKTCATLAWRTSACVDTESASNHTTSQWKEGVKVSSPPCATV
jgi:hypothetical protein